MRLAISLGVPFSAFGMMENYYCGSRKTNKEIIIYCAQPRDPFDAVLVLIGLQGHDLELAGGHQLFVDGTVDVEVVEGRRVLGASADSTARKTDVVRRAENENSFHLQKKNSKLTTTRD